MNSLRIAGLVLLLTFLTFDLSAQEENPAGQSLPEDVIGLRALAAKARDQGDTQVYRQALERLHQLRPNNSEYMYQLVLAHASLNEFTPALNMMLNMQRQGLSYDFDQAPETEPLRDKEAYEYINDLMVKAGTPLGSADLVVELSPDLGRAEAIDWDPGRQAWLVGTITDGRLLAVDGQGQVTELLHSDTENRLWGIWDLAVDAPRNRLWLAIAATPEYSGFDPLDKGRSALVEMKLDTLEVVKRYPVPVDAYPHVLGKMALAADGSVYLADRFLPIIYALRAGDDRLSGVYASNQLVSLRGIAVADDKHMLYFADYELGIIRLDMKTGQVAGLARPETLNLGGIDGLEYVDGALLVIQNGIRPQRILRLNLDVSGSQVTEIAPVAVALEAFDYPGFGVVVGGDLVFFGSGARSGQATAGQPIRLLRTSIQGLQNLVPPDMQRFLEQKARREREEIGLEAPGTDDSGR